MTKPFYILLLLFGAFRVAGQSAYSNFILADKYIWGLTTSGEIKLFDTADGKPANKTIQNTSKIVVLEKDAKGIPVIADSANEIKRYNVETNSWDLIATYDSSLYSLVFDSHNRCFAIQKNGIVNIQTRKNYFPDKSLNDELRYDKKWHRIPAYMMDSHDNLWIGFGFGEWGGDLYIFDAANEKYIELPPDCYASVSPVKSFFEDSTGVYYTSGLAHFSYSGSIYKYSNHRFDLILNSRTEYAGTTGRVTHAGQYIGPGAYNQYNHCIYFYSQNGIFKGDLTKNLSQLENWDNICKPSLHWRSGQPDAVGSPMNVTKLVFLNRDKFVILTQEDGIGLYDGRMMKMIN